MRCYARWRHLPRDHDAPCRLPLLDGSSATPPPPPSSLSLATYKQLPQPSTSWYYPSAHDKTQQRSHRAPSRNSLRLPLPRATALPTTLLHSCHRPTTMRSALLSVLIALFAALAMAAAPHRSVIVTWPNDTPDEIVEQSKEAIRKAKGKRTDGLSLFFPPMRIACGVCATCGERERKKKRLT